VVGLHACVLPSLPRSSAAGSMLGAMPAPRPPTALLMECAGGCWGAHKWEGQW
jgi:hypothetical protein